VITLSLFSGAYIAEIIRSGIESIRASIIDSAKAIGMKKHQIYLHVIFPLVFRQILPPLTGQFASIIKDSSLLSILGISEITFSAQQISSASFSTLESYIPLGLAYLLLTLPISILSKKMEQQFSYAS
jgi:polar amino acid transport system permease protein